MKKIINISAVILALLIMFVTIPINAGEEWDETYYRVVDYPDVLTDKERDSIDKACIEVVEAYCVDVSLLIVNTSDYEGITTMEALGSKEYEECGFGYGAAKDGIMAVYDIDKNDMVVNRYGSAATLITNELVNAIIDSSREELEENGVWGALYLVPAIVKNWMKIQTAKEAGTESEEETTVEAEIQAVQTVVNNEMPSWYPSDTKNFEFFHDAEAPRIVDEADIITGEEEDRIQVLIDEIREKYQKDTVIYTSNTSYGLGETTLATDFYDFCGYGFGDEYEGIILCVVMDPNDRGFAVSATGSETRGLYTQYNADNMDDRLVSFMKDRTDNNGNKIPGAYGEGIIDWVANYEKLLEYGYAFVPEWYEGSDVEQKHNAESARVTCSSNQLTSDQIQELEARCKDFSDRMGVDVAIHFTNSLYWMDIEEYADAFYKTMGYGFGENYDGILLLAQTIGKKSINYVSGDNYSKLTSVNNKRLNKRAVTELYNGAYESADAWLCNLDHMERTGLIKRSTIYWVVIIVIALIIGLIISSILLKRAVKMQEKPQLKMDALIYLVPGTLVVKTIKVTFLYSFVSSVYSPIKKSESSGSSYSSGSYSSSKSTYSSSYTGSSGREHTTSGRKF